MNTTITTSTAGRGEWLGLGVLAIACMLSTMDLTVLFLALPSISADLHPTSTQQLWITDVYGFMIAGSLITMGTLGDRIGRRKLLLRGAAAFGGLSVLAACSTSPSMLIVCRGLLGIAGATLAPATLSLVTTITVLAVVYGLKEIARNGLGASAVTALAGGLAVGVAFLRRQRRLEARLSIWRPLGPGCSRRPW